MKGRMILVLLLSIAAGSNVTARPQGESERAEAGPRFGAMQTRPHESQPAAPARAPQQAPQSTPQPTRQQAPQRGSQQAPQRAPQQAPQRAPQQEPRAPQTNQGGSQYRNPAPNWQAYRGYSDSVRDRDGDRHWSNGRGRDNYVRSRYNDFRTFNYRFNNGRYYARQRFSIGIYLAPRGFATRVWYVGDWLPYAYYDDMRYRIDNPWSYNLYDAPIGCHWVRVGADALLIDYFSGEILEVVYGLFW